MPAPASSDLPALGVGLTYSSAIEPVLQRWPDLVDVLEVEPQTTWTETRDPAQPYHVADAVLAHIQQLPGRKLVHSVGVPCGGTPRPEPYQLGLLAHTVARLRSPWFSEHLSFNQAEGFFTGFFLPPRQTTEGVLAATRAIHDLQAALPVPVAVETGVNYLRPRADEMPDGAFVAQVTTRADCGILLDLHNIFCNAVNGRQAIDDFLAPIPLDRVWEMHLAGGMEIEGYWLDAHSGAMPDALFDIARRLIPRLPNLRAIIFEMMPSYLPAVGYDTLARELERLHSLWALRRAARGDGPVVRTASDVATAPTAASIPDAGSRVTPAAWESALGALAVGRQVDGVIGRELAADPGVAIIHRLIGEFRASMVVGVLRLTSRYLMLSLGPDILRALLQDFWSKHPPRPYASMEAEAFAEYLTELNLQLPQLATVLRFERAVLATLLDGQPRVVAFDFDPFPLFRALTEARLPDEPGSAGNYEIEITPDIPLATRHAEETAARQTFPFH